MTRRRDYLMTLHFLNGPKTGSVDEICQQQILGTDSISTLIHKEIFLRNTQNSADVRIKSFRMFNRIMYQLRIKY